MAGEFEGRIAIVTGAAGGVGSAVVRRLAEAGAGSSPSISRRRCASSRPSAILAVEGDASLDGDGRARGRRGARPVGAFDVLVNNAGHIVYKTILDTSDDGLVPRARRERAQHVRALPRRDSGDARRRRGAIVNTASISGLIGFPALTAYTASKGAVVQLTRQLAVEWAPAGIRVNAVAPGALDTPFLTDFVALQDDPDGVAAAIKGPSARTLRHRGRGGAVGRLPRLGRGNVRHRRSADGGRGFTAQ